MFKRTMSATVFKQKYFNCFEAFQRCQRLAGDRRGRRTSCSSTCRPSSRPGLPALVAALCSTTNSRVYACDTGLRTSSRSQISTHIALRPLRPTASKVLLHFLQPTPHVLPPTPGILFKLLATCLALFRGHLLVRHRAARESGGRGAGGAS